MACTCPELHLNTSDRRSGTGAYNWNPECVEHGVRSEWWNSPEQVERRRKSSERLRDLQARARQARCQDLSIKQPTKDKANADE